VRPPGCAGSSGRSAAASASLCNHRSTPIPTTSDAVGASMSNGAKVGANITAPSPNTPSTITTAIPGPGCRREATPASAAITPITTAIPASSTGLSAVPKVAFANSVSQCGERRTTVSPTARYGDDAGASRPATSSPAASAAATAMTPTTAAHPSGIPGAAGGTDRCGASAVLT
jgi:hypothetical protein